MEEEGGDRKERKSRTTSRQQRKGRQTGLGERKASHTAVRAPLGAGPRPTLGPAAFPTAGPRGARNKSRQGLAQEGRGSKPPCKEHGVPGSQGQTTAGGICLFRGESKPSIRKAF